jgi:S-phase kinase-associated protein 1
MFLESSDGAKIEVSKEAASLFQTVKNMIDDLDMKDDSTTIPLPQVSEKPLSKAIELATKYVVKTEEELQQYSEKIKVDDFIDPEDKKFLDIPQQELFDLIMAANYLDFKLLLDLCCSTVAQQIKGMTPEQIRQTFNIKNDFVMLSNS